MKIINIIYHRILFVKVNHLFKKKKFRFNNIFFIHIEYCHLHGICWQSIKSDKSLYDKMREYLNNLRLEIMDSLNENKMRTPTNEESGQ